jgi:heme/copper-type cytochrome/quinol oxidase subunit 2
MTKRLNTYKVIILLMVENKNYQNAIKSSYFEISVAILWIITTLLYTNVIYQTLQWMDSNFNLLYVISLMITFTILYLVLNNIFKGNVKDKIFELKNRKKNESKVDIIWIIIPIVMIILLFIF